MLTVPVDLTAGFQIIPDRKSVPIKRTIPKKAKTKTQLRQTGANWKSAFTGIRDEMGALPVSCYDRMSSFFDSLF